VFKATPWRGSRRGGNGRARPDEQQGGAANRRQVRSEYGKSLLRRHGESGERSYAHCCAADGTRRCHLRGQENILKRQLVHVSAFNLSLTLRKLLGIGTTREWKNRAWLLLGGDTIFGASTPEKPEKLRG
jgi:hypothetical protein